MSLNIIPAIANSIDITGFPSTAKTSSIDPNSNLSQSVSNSSTPELSTTNSAPIALVASTKVTDAANPKTAVSLASSTNTANPTATTPTLKSTAGILSVPAIPLNLSSTPAINPSPTIEPPILGAATASISAAPKITSSIPTIPPSLSILPTPKTPSKVICSTPLADLPTTITPPVISTGVQPIVPTPITPPAVSTSTLIDGTTPIQLIAPTLITPPPNINNTTVFQPIELAPTPKTTEIIVDAAPTPSVPVSFAVPPTIPTSIIDNISPTPTLPIPSNLLTPTTVPTDNILDESLTPTQSTPPILPTPTDTVITTPPILIPPTPALVIPPSLTGTVITTPSTLIPAIPVLTIPPVAPTSATPPTIAVGTNNLLNIQNGIVRLQFTPGVSSAAFNNEMGAFVVDDEQGRINGILPGAPGYLAAAMKTAEVIGGKGDNTLPLGNSHQLIFKENTKLGFYLVQNGSTAEVKADLAAGKSPSCPVFFQTGNPDGEHLKVNQSGSNYTFNWEDTVGGGDRDFNDLVINATISNSPQAQGSLLQGLIPSIVDLSDITGTKTASVIVGGNSSYNNSVGFYRVDNLQGVIGTLNPGDPGYAEAAIARNISNCSTASGEGTVTVGAGIFAPYMIANGTAESFLAKNPTNQGGSNMPNAYFAYIGSNPDKLDHVRLLGDNKFGFEDMFGGGDRDFNDAIVQLRVTT